MSRASEKTNVVLEDVDGTFATFTREAPKLVKKLLGTAVFLTESRVLKTMEANAPLGTDGGLTPGEHIKWDLEGDWKASYPLSAKVGILNNDEQAHVALYNEYVPNAQPFMRPAASVNAEYFKAQAIAALERIAAQFADGARATPGTRG